MSSVEAVVSFAGSDNEDSEWEEDVALHYQTTLSLFFIMGAMAAAQWKNDHF